MCKIDDEKIKKCLSISFKRLEEIQQYNKDHPDTPYGSQYFTGITELDYLGVWLAPRSLCLVAARPGMGKTSFMAQLAENIIRAGRRVMIFSFELLKERLESIMDIPDESRKDLAICDDFGLSVEDIKKRYDEYGGANVVFIDYLSLIGDQRENESIPEQMTRNLEELKDFSAEKQTCIVVISQLRRYYKPSDYREPTLSDLREYGALTQDPDTIILIHRYGYTEKERERSPHGALIVAKNRFGKTGKVNVEVKYVKDGKSLRFIPIVEKTEDCDGDGMETEP